MSTFRYGLSHHVTGRMKCEYADCFLIILSNTSLSHGSYVSNMPHEFCLHLSHSTTDPELLSLIRFPGNRA